MIDRAHPCGCECHDSGADGCGSCIFKDHSTPPGCACRHCRPCPSPRWDAREIADRLWDVRYEWARTQVRRMLDEIAAEAHAELLSPLREHWARLGRAALGRGLTMSHRWKQTAKMADATARLRLLRGIS